ncbi:MAG: 2TM domain-containing protein [Rhodospirillaceae bacterium]|nr:2TM domain-containing protein [Rhodospirillaceae bacterium]
MTGGPMTGGPMTGDPAERARRRRNAFALHLGGYFAAMAVLVQLNLFLIAPARPWFVLPLVGWGSVLGIHCAFAMGLFDRRRD